MGNERDDDAERRARANVYASARIGAAAALTIVLVVLLVLDVAVIAYVGVEPLLVNGVLPGPAGPNAASTTSWWTYGSAALPRRRRMPRRTGGLSFSPSKSMYRARRA